MCMLPPYQTPQQLCKLGLPSLTHMGLIGLVGITDLKKIQVPLNHEKQGTIHYGAAILSSAASAQPVNAEGMECSWGFSGGRAQDLSGANLGSQN